ncbi:beta-N-acetylhexosaminidase [Pedobacter rhizosphaerae]|nr:beta-N-acetylhexosaminidase [Pedobacter rhizosphaerae]
MKKTCLSLFLLLLAACFNSLGAQQLAIIPEPVKTERFKGSFLLSDPVKIYADAKDSLIRLHADYLSAALKTVTGLEPGRSDQKSRAQFRLLKGKFAGLGEEGYLLNIDASGISISANTGKGIFYGIQSLLQLLPAYQNNAIISLPYLKVTDYPRFGWRGMMLDVSRHFFSAEAVKRYIDLLAAYKMNVFHWHLSDSEGWRLEIKKYPKLTRVGAWRKEVPGSVFYRNHQALPADTFNYGGYYTQSEAREIVHYASLRNITVIPEIDMPGHSDAAIAAYPGLSCSGLAQPVRSSFGGDPNALANYCAGKEESFQFLEGVLSEVIDIFPSAYIHIGGDEVNKTSWKNCSACQQRIKNQGLKDEHELQSYFISRIGRFLQSKDRKLIGWDEILEGGLPGGATVMSWRGESGGIKAARMHRTVVMTPVKPLYFNRYQADTLTVQQPLAARFSINTLKDVYQYRPIPKELSSTEASFVLGAQGCLWTEFISSENDLERMVLPRMLALSEVLWSKEQSLNWNKFNNKLYFHAKRLGAEGKNIFSGVPFLYNNIEVR